jgi:hypothetical protein
MHPAMETTCVGGGRPNGGVFEGCHTRRRHPEPYPDPRIVTPEVAAFLVVRNTAFGLSRAALKGPRHVNFVRTQQFWSGSCLKPVQDFGAWKCAI